MNIADPKLEPGSSPKKVENRELSQIFKTIADLLEINGENIYKVLAYRKAADSLAVFPESAVDLWKQGRLNEIPGVGKAIAEKIDELERTGRLEFFERLQAEIPLGLADLLQVPDIGPRKAALFWKELGVTNLADLEAAANAGKLRELPGLGEKSEARILAGIAALGRRTNRTPLGQAWPFARQLIEWLAGLPGVIAVDAAGSLRRMKPTIGDIDLAGATRDPVAVMQAFVDHPQVRSVFGHGDTKSSVEFNNGQRAQLWLHPPEEYGTALVYATGSKDHNVRLREIAQKRGLSLSDHSYLKPDGSEIFCSSEEDVYKTLGMDWVPPELREDRGEIEAAQKKRLPRLIERPDLIAELHTHSTWSDGQVSILDMATAAIQRGYQVLAITDHSASLGVAGGLSRDELIKQRKEIDAAQQKLGSQIRLLQGAEVEIRSDGSLDYPDEDLARLDIVIASLHSGLRQPREQVTRRLIRAIQNPNVNIIGHPTGRMIPDREGADLDMEAVLEAAKASQVALEINAHPARLDLDEVTARRASQLGIPLSLNTDAHAPDQMDLIEFGLATARRGWLEAKHVINAWPAEKLLDWLKAK